MNGEKLGELARSRDRHATCIGLLFQDAYASKTPSEIDGWPDDMNNLRIACRQLLKQPGFTAAAVLTLALGIGANITIFTIVNWLFLQPLPVKDPASLVLILQRNSVWSMPYGHSWLDYRDYRDQVETVEDAVATFMNPVHLSAERREPERAWVEAVSGNYFSMLGLQPSLGRLFLPGEGEKTDADPILVLSHRCWKQRFGGDPSIVGRTVNINGHPFTVVGVGPETFLSAQWGLAVDGFVPATMLGKVRPGGSVFLQERGATAFKIFARMKPGATLAQTRAAVGVVAQRLAADYPEQQKDTKVFVAPEWRCRPDPALSDYMPVISAVFMAMVGLVLLIACANVANLMFARALTRAKEMALRTALGASRAQLIGQVLVESVLLALLAGLGGMLIAAWSGRLLDRFSPGGEMPVAMAQSDWRVAAYTFLLSLVAGIVTGLGPAWRGTRLDLQSTLKETSAGADSRKHPLRSLLVVSQVAFSIAVIAAGGLFVSSLQGVAHIDLGFRPANLAMVSLDLGLQGYTEERGREFYRQLSQEIRALPGVRSASLGQMVPFDYFYDLGRVTPEDKAGDPDADLTVHFNRVDHEYLPTLGFTLLQGRNFLPRDDAEAPRVAIVNTELAKQLWPGQEAVGKRFQWRGGAAWEVVGVIRAAKHVTVGEDPKPIFYVPLVQSYVTPVTLHVATSGDPSAFLPAIRKVLRGLDPHLPVYNQRTMAEHLQNSAFGLMPLRMGAALAGVQGMVGLLLAVLGLYSVVAYTVNRRTREIGIRVALGARKVDVLKLVSREGLRLTLAGAVIGLLGAFALCRVLVGLLHGLAPSAAPVLAGAVLLLAAVAALACWLPARRATRVDPMIALRAE